MIGSQSNAMEVNLRSVLAMRLIGQGQAGLETLCWAMDLPPPIAQTSYDRSVQRIHEASIAVCKDSTSRAAQEEKELTGTGGLYVSGDGSWRKPGFKSLQGLAHVIGAKTGKVLDHEMKSKYCKECELWEKKCGSEEYLEWLEKHESCCDANYEGSSGGMEVAAIVDIFRRSEEKHKVKYLFYVGDGDSKTFKAVFEADPYPGETVTKKECVGHVQKRFGTRVRTLVASLKGQKLKDKKGLTGKGRLTAKAIDQLQHYYGNAIRANCNSVADMKKAAMATYYHYASSDTQPTHHLCPTGEDSWCRWQQAKAKGENMKRFKLKNKVPPICIKALKPMYEALTSDVLLERCLRGFTQNANESLNNNVWKLLPKKSFSGTKVLELGGDIAVSVFNDGHNATLDLLEEMGISVGVHCINGALKADNKRISKAERCALLTTLESRRAKRRARLQAEEEADRAGDASYAAGAF